MRQARGGLIYYSLALVGKQPRHDLLWQLDASLTSLRRHNPSVPVALFVYGDIVPDVMDIAGRHAVMVHQHERYEIRLARLCPRGWPVLSRYPLLHKFLNFPEISNIRPQPRQVLFLDCDTLFFDDVDRLFEGYTDGDCIAREEANCRRSYLGYDRQYLDEEALGRIAVSEGAAPVAPFNLGVVLFNNGSWRRIAGLERLLVSYAWRFTVWMAHNRPSGRTADYGDLMGTELISAGRVEVSREDLDTALPYPSANRWLLDECALWLTLGHLEGLQVGDFSSRDVLQNGEFFRCNPDAPGAILCHYFSQNAALIDSWIRRRPAQSAPRPVS